MSEYTRDTVVIEDIRVAWTEGHVQGFYPFSIFVKDESGNLINEEEVLFLQEFGFAPPAWRSIDEYPLPEATTEELLRAANASGVWEIIGTFDELMKSEVALDLVRRELARMGLAMAEVRSEPTLKLVPEWESVIQYDAYAARLKKLKEEEEKEEILDQIRRICPLCADARALFGGTLYFYHRSQFGYVDCKATREHSRLGTQGRPFPVEHGRKKEAYALLRGYMEKDNRFVSSKSIIRNHSAYRKLLDLGREAIPFIINDLREGRVGGIWTAEVLAELTGQRGGNPQWWLAWARSLGIAESL